MPAFFVTHVYVNHYFATGPSRIVLYVWCRDGKKKDHNGPSKTGKKRKHTVSRKVEGYCMERMIAVEQFSIRLNSCTISQETLVFSSLKAM